MTDPEHDGFINIPSAEERANRYQSMSIAEIIDEALTQLDAITLTPEQAGEILSFRLEIRSELIEESVLKPEDFVNDELFALSEIANGSESQSFGKMFRKYHVSSVDTPFTGGVRETSLVTDLNGAVWGDIRLRRRVQELRQQRGEGQ